MFAFREYVEASGFASYGPSLTRVFGYVADYGARGAKADVLPMQRPTKFEFEGNLANARALGIELPPALLAPADEVIE